MAGRPYLSVGYPQLYGLRRSDRLDQTRSLLSSFIDRLAQQIVLGPGEKLDLDNELGPHPMRAAEHEGQAEAGAARGRRIERIRVVASGCSRRPLKLGGIDTGADAAGVDQLFVRM